MEGLTSVFGMRTGVPPPLKHQLRNFKFNSIYLIVCSSPDQEQKGSGVVPIRKDLNLREKRLLREIYSFPKTAFLLLTRISIRRSTRLSYRGITTTHNQILFLQSRDIVPTRCVGIGGRSERIRTSDPGTDSQMDLRVSVLYQAELHREPCHAIELCIF